MKEKNKYIVLGFSEFLLVVIGLLAINHFDEILAFIMLPLFVALLLIDFKLLNIKLVLKKIDMNDKEKQKVKK